MKTYRSKLAVLICLATGPAISTRAAVTNVMGAVGMTSYTFSGVPGNNPTLTLFRGVTYVFSNTLPVDHPFFIKTNFSGGTTAQYTVGVTDNGKTNTIFVVPPGAPNQLFYNCSQHAITGMRGTMNINNPPAPPSGTIVLVSLSPNAVTMKSIGATNWNAIPEFTSNLFQVTWTTVPGFSNSLANGTNTTQFNRLDDLCGGKVFLRIRNTFP